MENMTEKWQGQKGRMTEENKEDLKEKEKKVQVVNYVLNNILI